MPYVRAACCKMHIAVKGNHQTIRPMTMYICIHPSLTNSPHPPPLQLMAYASRYASKLVELGIDGVDDLAELDEGDWKSMTNHIKQYHLKKMKKVLGIE